MTSNWNLKGRLHLWSSVIRVYIFPRCEAWRLKQWTINSWPTQEQGHWWEERKPKLKSNKYLRRATLKPWSITKIQQNCYIRAYLHSTTLSHATSLRHELFRVNQTYNSLMTLKSCRRPVISLSHATKSCRVNRPKEIHWKTERISISFFKVALND